MLNVSNKKIQRLVGSSSILLVALVDQLVKHIAVNYSTTLQFIDTIPFLKTTLTYNKGFAFGLLPEQNSIWLLIAVAVVGFIVIKWDSFDEKNKFAYGLLAAGALGNLLDRLFVGAVVDWLVIANITVVNYADIFITISIIWILLNEIKFGQNRNNN